MAIGAITSVNNWAGLDIYRGTNAALQPTPETPRIVFFGDSITRGWPDASPALFSAGRLNRGIGGQTTAQLLLRFRQDVLDLHPAVVHIMGGINDIAGNAGPMTREETANNIRSIVDLARAHGIRVILGSLTPADLIPWRRTIVVGSQVTILNAWLAGYARATGSTYADYWTALTEHGWPASPVAALTTDGVHLSREGYAVIAPVAELAIGEALAGPAPDGSSSEKQRC